MDDLTHHTVWCSQLTIELMPIAAWGLSGLSARLTLGCTIVCTRDTENSEFEQIIDKIGDEGTQGPVAQLHLIVVPGRRFRDSSCRFVLGSWG